jgi:uncharacterized cupredoxin-like copper-binding protein
MRARTWLIAGAATVLLAAGSVAVLAATRPGLSGGAANCTVPSLDGQQGQGVLADMGGMMGGRMMLGAAPRTVAAGTVRFMSANHGVCAHELLVLPLPDGHSVGSRPVNADDTIDETGSLGEASRDCGTGHGDGITPGQAGCVPLTVQPGRDELVCNQPGHYAAGDVRRARRHLTELLDRLNPPALGHG